MDRQLTRRQIVQGAGAVGLGLLAGCGVPWSPSAAGKPYVVGYLTLTGSQSLVQRAFGDALHELGYEEGRNLSLQLRSAEGHSELLAALAAELVSLPVDVLVTSPTQPTQAAMQASSKVPIVFVNVSDPVGAGLVTSLAQPGGQVTGVSTLATGMVGKRLELLQSILPTASRVAVLWNPGNPSSVLEWQELQEVGRSLSLQLQAVEARSPDEIDGAVAAAGRLGAGALFVITDPLFAPPYLERIVQAATRNRWPSAYTFASFPEAGGLMAYGPSLAANARRAAYYVDRILKGAKPADLPAEQPMRFDFVINLRTAQTLGLTIPHHVLLQATEVIQ
jgi:putative tryptophan/tyrosine transport system substrate-binding protein